MRVKAKRENYLELEFVPAPKSVEGGGQESGVLRERLHPTKGYRLHARHPRSQAEAALQRRKQGMYVLPGRTRYTGRPTAPRWLEYALALDRDETCASSEQMSETKSSTKKQPGGVSAKTHVRT